MAKTEIEIEIEKKIDFNYDDIICIGMVNHLYKIHMFERDIENRNRKKMYISTIRLLWIHICNHAYISTL